MDILKELGQIHWIYIDSYKNYSLSFYLFQISRIVVREIIDENRDIIVYNKVKMFITLLYASFLQIMGLTRNEKTCAAKAADKRQNYEKLRLLQQHSLEKIVYSYFLCLGIPEMHPLVLIKG